MSQYLDTLQEDAHFYFDADAGERPIRFIERYCVHYEGTLFAGKPFLLLTWQKQIIRTLFGWRRRRDKLRRFREMYLLTAKGAGKTPLLSAIGLFMLLADKEPAAHVISMASTFEQANLTFDAGKKYIGESPKLSNLAAPKQHIIRGPKHAKWTTISGKPTGRSGTRPSCIIGDEVHEWPGATAQAYELLTANAFKRQQPLVMLATNAGESTASYCYQVHQRAERVAAGELVDPTLLPVIYEADKDLEWTSEAAAAAANPSLGQVVTFEQVQPRLRKAQETPEGEREYRRLYLSQWPGVSAIRWLDMALWDECQSDEKPPADAPIYPGLDLSMSDDLSAAVWTWVSAEVFWVDAHYWLPRVTAEKYEKKDGIPYSQWAAAGWITLVEEPTINSTIRRKIAEAVISQAKGRKLVAVAYDRYKADETVAAIAGAGLTCVPVAQGYSVSPGCHELDRRLKEGSIRLSRNPVLRWNAANTEVKADDRGNIWPIKPNAKAKYAGTRALKIDGISALVTSLTEARKHVFPNARKMWKGEVCAVSRHQTAGR